jgi:hypothetical protein
LDNHGAKPTSDQLASLNEVCKLLAVDPKFQVMQVGQAPPKQLHLGWIIREIGLLRFGAVFSGALTLLGFQIEVREPGNIVMDLRWNLTTKRPGWVVFIHFLDENGIQRLQGDYSLDDAVPDPLGFVYSRRIIEVPREVGRGTYRVRLGVWSPKEGRRLRLGRIRGCQREPSGPNHDAVLLKVFTI